MIEYELKDSEDNTYSLNGLGVTALLKNSISQGADIFEYDNKIVERSFLPGSSLIGNKRLMSREFTMFLTRANDVEADYKSASNELLMWLQKTKYLVDITNSLQIEITINNVEISYDPGSLKHSSDDHFSFTALTPYWSNLEDSTVSGTALADVIKEQSVNNSGYLNAYPVITLVATIPTDDIQIYINSNNTGIQILDSAFGTGGNLTMVIDCEAGLITINDINRNVNIVPGTGFFDIPIGADIINILSSEEIEYTIDWKERSYI